ncbi:MAG: hypothetical protein NUW01_15580 [Gemmatimonadaceae bacterium]|nr:hypothetical protein [Gemmatimonadaceae bacterium]
MKRDLIKWGAPPIIAVVIAGCGGERSGPDATTVSTSHPAGPATGVVAGGSDLWWRNETYRELDGDEENAERLVATVSKGPLDLTMVRLEIRTSKDRILYRHEWPATSYMKYGAPGSAKDSAAVLRAAELQIGKIFADSAFITGSAAPRYSGKTEPDLDAIRYDIAEHEYRTANALKRWAPLPAGAYDELNTFARAVPLARIQAVAAETGAMPAFWYYAGGEETYVVAWSPTEGRLVRIASCC